MNLANINKARDPKAAAASIEFHRRNIDVVEVDKLQWKVAGRFGFWPATGYWRELEGGRQGYGTRTLIAAINTPAQPATVHQLRPQHTQGAKNEEGA